MKIRSFWNILEELCALLAAAGIIILGYFDIIEFETILYGLLAMLGFVTMQFIKTKKEIHDQQTELTKTLNALDAVRLNQN